MNKNKKEKVAPSRLAWFIYVTLGRIYMFFKNKITVNRKEFKNRNKKEGCIVIYNHASNKDHFFTTFSFGYTRAVYVVSTHFFFSKKLSRILKWVRAIPKEQFKADIGAIKKIKRALQQGLPIAIAPAGQITVHGDALSIDPSIIKLLKMCKVDVYAIQIHGNYFAYPKWRKYRRKSPIHTEFVKVFDKNELETLSDEHAYQKVCDAIYVNDRLEISQFHYNLKSKALIEGLENVLYQCPKCRTKYQMISNTDTMQCQNCGYSVTMNRHGLLESSNGDTLIIKNETDWYKWEQKNMIESINAGTFYLEGKFRLYHNLFDEYVLDEVGSGKVVLTATEFYYEGSFDGTMIKKNFKLERLSQLPFEVRSHFDIPDDDGCFEFKPTDNEKYSTIIEFVQAIDIMSQMRKTKQHD